MPMSILLVVALALAIAVLLSGGYLAELSSPSLPPPACDFRLPAGCVTANEATSACKFELFGTPHCKGLR